MGGDPTPKRSAAYVRALASGGASVIELGVPFSDPIADGPTIQAAGLRSRAGGTTLQSLLRSAKQIHRQIDPPLVLMLYVNLIEQRGVQPFFDAVAAVGIAGVIVPDLPLEESGPFSEAAQAAGIDLPLLAAPSSGPRRLAAIARSSSGFVYLVSRYGTTGARKGLSPQTRELIGQAREHAASARLPLAPGFGIATPADVRAVWAAGAQAAVVGSALVRTVASGAPPTALRTQVERLMGRRR